MDWVGLEGLGIKALNRENRLECIRQSIRVQFDHRLRALGPSGRFFFSHVMDNLSLEVVFKGFPA